MGTVTDSVTHAPLPDISIGIKNSPLGTVTNGQGRFRINAGSNARQIVFSAAGYHEMILPLTDDPVQTINVALSKAYTELKGVVVKGKRGKYRNKNNPAVELIRQVIDNKEKNGPDASAWLSYRQYEKTRFLWDRSLAKVTQLKLMKKFRFFTENVDTTIVPGTSLISIYMQEILSQHYYRKDPEKKKQIILSRKSVDYGEFIDMNGISEAFNRIYEPVNIYDNNVPIFATQFLSPVANLAPTFYMYFIRDTVVENGIPLVKLYFTPRNPEDLLFRGNLYITLDGNYAIRRVELGISKVANLNWARDVHVTQDFERGPGQRYHLVMSDMSAWYRLLPKAPGLYGDRTEWFSNLSDSAIADSLLKGPSLDSLPEAASQPDTFWTANRPIPLSQPEQKTYENTERLVKMRSYHRLMDLITLYNAGYKSAGPSISGRPVDFILSTPWRGSGSGSEADRTPN